VNRLTALIIAAKATLGVWLPALPPPFRLEPTPVHSDDRKVMTKGGLG